MNRNLISLVIGFACLASFAHAQRPERIDSSPQFERREHREGDKKLPYRLMVPRDYDAAKSWPLIVWLHGSGEIGNNNTAQLSGITSTFLGNNKKCPALVMVPQCPEGSSWLGVGLNEPPKITEPSRMIIAIVADLQKEFKLDDRRIYIGGFSMGGCGTWDLLSRYPNLFAAAFPIAGPPGDRKGLAPLVKEVPIWVFHGDNDPVAPVDSSRTIVAALKAIDAPVKYTEYRNGGHEMSQALADPLLQEWLFVQRRSAAPSFTPSKVPDDASLITKTIAHGIHKTWTGKVERTGHGVPRFVIGEVRYLLKPELRATAEVVDVLAKIGKGEMKGDHTITGTIQLDERAWLVVEKIVAAADDGASKPLRILLIGNSQCPAIISNQMLEKLAASDKGARPIEVVGCIRGGASLRSHWEAGTDPDTARSKIANGPWDFVVLQDIYNVEAEGFQPYARKFHKLIKERGARTVLFGTASILTDYPKGFERLHSLHMAMGKELEVPIVDASQSYVRYFGGKPSADRMESLFAKDRNHPGLQGSYLYSCGIYSVLTGRSPVGLAAPEAIPADVAKSLQETAWAQYQETIAALKMQVNANAKDACDNLNYDESKVGDYTVPDPLLGKDGKRVINVASWKATRRSEILRDFRDKMYGHTPELPIKLRPEVISTCKDAVDGLATRTIVKLHLFDDPKAPQIELMVYLPNKKTKPVPMFLGLSFTGNASIEDDPTIPLPTGWMRPQEGVVVNNRATEKLRGTGAASWPIKTALERGYGVATFYYGDVEPDHIEGWRDGIRGYALKLAGRTERGQRDWGALGAWAWGLSCAMDYLAAIPEVNADQVVVLGHSRLGKTALWAGAQDERFAIVISNNSGEGGAALARRNFGENIACSIDHASWRYCDQFRDYVDREKDLPFDQHMLLGLVAPRPVYIASATKDSLADPKGEFLTAVHAEPIYRLFGLRGLDTTIWPTPDKPIGQTIGYHLRTGEHAITKYDWQEYLGFADRQFKTLVSQKKR